MRQFHEHRLLRFERHRQNRLLRVQRREMVVREHDGVAVPGWDRLLSWARGRAEATR